MASSSPAPPGMGPEGHTIAGQMIDQMHGEGAHHKMHKFMDQMMAEMMAIQGDSMIKKGRKQAREAGK